MKNEFSEINLAVDEFIKNGISSILNSRIKCFNKSNLGSISNYNTKADSLSFSLDDSFLEDYSSFNNSFYRMNIVEIYYKEKDFCLLIEKWSFEFNSKEFNDKKQCLKIFSNLKKSIYCLCRILPSNSLFKKFSNKFELEYRIMSHYNKQKFFDEEKFHVENIEINKNVSVEFISIDQILREKNIFENSKNEFMIIENNNNLIKKENRKTSLSQGLSEFEDLSIINGNNLSFQSDNNEINDVFELNKDYNQKNYDKLNLKERSNNSNDSFEFEILENKMDTNDF